MKSPQYMNGWDAMNITKPWLKAKREITAVRSRPKVMRRYTPFITAFTL